MNAAQMTCTPDDFVIFLPGEGHTLAGILRPYLRPASSSSITYAVVTDPMCEDAGLRIRASSRESVVEAIQMARRLLDTWQESVVQTH